MEQALTIEKNIPIKTTATTSVGQALRSMEAGDSFVTDKRPAGGVISAVGGKKFVTRTVENGIRVWRIA